VTINVLFSRETKNYAVYESEEMDWSISCIRVKLWIPKEEIQTNIPGVYPPKIPLRIIDDNA
jgi:hypothetical protein